MAAPPASSNRPRAAGVRAVTPAAPRTCAFSLPLPLSPTLCLSGAYSRDCFHPSGDLSVPARKLGQNVLSSVGEQPALAPASNPHRREFLRNVRCLGALPQRVSGLLSDDSRCAFSCWRCRHGSEERRGVGGGRVFEHGGGCRAGGAEGFARWHSGHHAEEGDPPPFSLPSSVLPRCQESLQCTRTWFQRINAASHRN